MGHVLGTADTRARGCHDRLGPTGIPVPDAGDVAYLGLRLTPPAAERDRAPSA